MPLRDVIQDFIHEQRRAMSEAEYKELMADMLATAEQVTTQNALRTGDPAPNFALTNAQGKKVTLDGLLRDGPVVLSFYRGGWCPFCNIELDALQQALPEIRERGASLVAVSPQTVEHTRETAARGNLTFTLLSDEGSAVARRYGLAFNVGEAGKRFHEQHHEPLPAFTGDAEWVLPIPGTYVIAPGPRVAWSFVDSNYTERAEPADILDALDTLVAAKTREELEE